MTDDTITAQCNALFATNRASEALSLIRRHAANDDPNALYLLALHILSGEFVARDLAKSRQILRRATAKGHIDATMLDIALTANGAGAPPDWQAARRMLQRSACSIPAAAEQSALLDAMAIDDKGEPRQIPQGHQLATLPDVRRFHNLLTPGECAHLATVARDLLAPATVFDPQSKRMIRHPIRTSDGAVIGPGREDLVVRAINHRIASISETAVIHGEPLSILRYTPGQQYRPHLDSITGARNQRTKTVIIYLNHGYTGGETRFIYPNLNVKPHGGDAILFANVLPDGSVDKRSDHAGLPVIQGTKWIATRWIRNYPYDPWNDH